MTIPKAPRFAISMRLPRVRLRALMIAVAVVALLLWGGMLARRRQAYLKLARGYRQDAAALAELERLELESVKEDERELAETAAHAAEDERHAARAVGQEREELLRHMELGRESSEVLAEFAESSREGAAGFGSTRRRFEDLARKYEYAARHPWLLVRPDPPPPK